MSVGVDFIGACIIPLKIYAFPNKNNCHHRHALDKLVSF